MKDKVEPLICRWPSVLFLLDLNSSHEPFLRTVAFRPLQRSNPESARKQPEGCGPHGFRFTSRVHGFLAVATSHEPGRASPSRRAARRAWNTSDSARWGQARPTVRDRVAIAQVMMAPEQEPEQRPLCRTLHRQQLQRLELGQETLHRTLLAFDGLNLPIAQAVHGRGPPRRQADQPPLLQLQKQTAAGHVLQTPGPVAPMPALTQLAGEPRSVPRRIGFQRRGGVRLQRGLGSA
ncbi:MAG: hypothetical protein FJ398_05565 [Verrucomicrobia bacterium]|nr:hypothetical protein [Verrucomicrobiota bacterium]